MTLARVHRLAQADATRPLLPWALSAAGRQGQLALLQQQAAARGQPIPQFDPISLRLRATPFMEMLQRCHQAGVEVIWGI